MDKKKIAIIVVSVVLVLAVVAAGVVAGVMLNKKLTVTFESSGEVISTLKAKKGTRITPPKIVNRYTDEHLISFSHWRIKGENNRIDFTKYKINEAMTFEAVLKKTPLYTASFELGFAYPNDTFNPKVFAEGAKLSEMPIPQREGYEFDGWFEDEEHTLYIDDLTNYTISSDTKIYAGWRKVYDVIFENYDGTVVERQKVADSKFAKTPSVEPERPETDIATYTFYGWKVKGTENNYPKISEYPIKGNTAFVAVYKEKPKNATVKFMVDNQVHSEVVVTIGSMVARPQDPIKNEHVFKNWFYGNGIPYDFDYEVTGNITLEARFEINKYTLNINLNYGENPIIKKSNAYGSLWQVQDYTRTGYRLVGWFLGTEEGDDEFIFDGVNNIANAENSSLNGEINQKTIYAKWEIIENTIEYSFTDGLKAEHRQEASNPNSEIISYNVETPTITFEDAIRYGYTFEGWYTTNTYNIDSKKSSIAKGSIGNVSLYAKWKIDTYRVDFVTNIEGGTGFYRTATYDTLLEKPNDPIKTGHTFKGWFEDEAFTTEFNLEETKIVKKLTLYGSWEINEYNLEIEIYEGETHPTFSVGKNYITKKYNEAWNDTEIEGPTKEHYDFKDWVYKSSGRSFKFEHKAIEDVQIKANYLKKQYTIDFDSNGGSEISQGSANYYENWAKPTNPTKEGHDFNYWCEDQELTTEFNFLEKRAEGNITVYAKWTAIKYNLTLDANTGKFGTSSTAVIKADYNTAWNKDGFTPPTKKGHSLINWYLGAAINSELYIWATLASEENQRTIYAHWKKESYNLIFNTNGGEEIESYTWGYDETLELPTPLYANHDFDGWTYLDPVNSIYEPISLLNGKMPDYDLNLKATWKKQKYTVTLTLVEGEEVLSAGTENPIIRDFDVVWGEEPTPTKDHHDFQGWYYDVDGVDTKFDFTKTALETGSKTLSAKWTLSNYKLTFINEFSSDPNIVHEAVYNTTWTKPADPQVNGYTFVGWRKAGVNQNFNFETLAIEDLTLYARWTTNEYNITWDLYSSTGGNTNHVASHPNTKNKYKVTDDTYTLLAATRTGYQFEGWYDSLEETGNLVTTINNGSYGHKTFYAKWQINTYTLTFRDPTAGEPVLGTQTINYDTNWIALDPAPEKTHYDFQGWFNNTNGAGGEFDFAQTKATEDKTVYAYFTILQYTLTFDSDGGGAVNAITQNALTTWAKPYNPTKTDGTLDYVLEHWYVIPNEGSPDDSIPFVFAIATESVNLKAKWIVKQYTLTIDLVGGSHIQDPDNTGFVKITVDMNQAWNVNQSTWTNNKPDDATKLGYTFDGFKDFGSTTAFDFTSTANSNITIYATWTVIEYNIYYANIPVANIPPQFKTKYTVSTPTIDLDEYRTQMERALYSDLGDQTLYRANIAKWLRTDASGEEVLSIPKGSTSDITLWAEWVEHEWDIIYNIYSVGAENNENNPNKFKNSNPADIVLYPASREHYNFVSWHTDESLSSDSLVPSSGLPSSRRANYNLYAKWSPIDYTINYVLEAGATDIILPSPSTYNVETPTFDLGKAYWKNSQGNHMQTKFWYTQQNHNNNNAYKIEFFNPQSSPIPLGNISFYASSEARAHIITYNTNLTYDEHEGNTHNFTSDAIAYNTNATAPTNPIQEGFSFDGWYKDGALFDFANTPITADISLTAQWTRLEYNMTFDKGDGSANTVFQKEYYYQLTNSDSDIPNMSSVTGFQYWYYVANGEEIILDAIGVTVASDLTFFAKIT